MSLEVRIEVPERGVQVQVAVARGETCALIGPNGAGKSTVLQSVIGVTAARGQVVLDDRVLTGAGASVPIHRRRIGWLAQRPLLFDHLSVLDNVAFGAAADRSRADARRRALSELDSLGVADLAARRPSELSGGQAQRVALARCLASDPQALLLDEPLAAIDAPAAEGIRQHLAERLHGLGRPVLLVTHDLIDLWRLADRVVVLERGRVVEQGTVTDVLARPRHAFLARLGGRNLIAGAALGGDAVAAGDLVVHGRPDVPLTAGGATLALIDPAAIAVHRSHPEGSPRNVWPARVIAVEPRGDAVRLTCTAGGQPLAVDLTRAAVAELGLRPGLEVWLSVKASQVVLYPR